MIGGISGLLGLGAALAGDPAHHHEAADDGALVEHRFDDVQRWVKAFDDPARDAWQQPAALVAALQVTPGSTVADIGAGTGYFNRTLAAAVGPTGRVIAVDIEPNLVEHMKTRAAAEGSPQVEARLGAPSDPKLAAGEVDLVLLVDTYHHIDGRRDYFTRLGAALKPQGRLVVVDFKPGEQPVGPPADHKVPPEQVKQELAAAGWSLVADLELLPYQFVHIYERTR